MKGEPTQPSMEPQEPKQEAERDDTAFSAENLSTETARERRDCMKTLKEGVIEWAKTHMDPIFEKENRDGRWLKPEECRDLVVHLLHTEPYKKAAYDIAKHFMDREQYVGRPSILLYENGGGKDGDSKIDLDTDVYMLAWRAPEGGTKDENLDKEPEAVPDQLVAQKTEFSDRTFIHDHEASGAGIEPMGGKDEDGNDNVYMYKGEPRKFVPVVEDLYATQHTITAHADEKNYIDPKYFNQEDFDKWGGPAYPYSTSTRRAANGGGGLVVGYPYIHTFRGPQKEGEMAVTVHAYSTDPKTVPEEYLPEEYKGLVDTRGALYKMNYFSLVSQDNPAFNPNDSNSRVPEKIKRLLHLGYYVMFKPKEEQIDVIKTRLAAEDLNTEVKQKLEILLKNLEGSDDYMLFMKGGVEGTESAQEIEDSTITSAGAWNLCVSPTNVPDL